MKTLISDTDGFKIQMELTPCLHPLGHYRLRFSSVWENARSKVHEQTQYELILPMAQLKKIKDLL